MAAYKRQFTAGTCEEVTILLRYHSEKKKTNNTRTRTIKKLFKIHDWARYKIR